MTIRHGIIAAMKAKLVCMACDQYHGPEHFQDLKIRADGAVTALCSTTNKREVYNSPVRVKKIVTA
jgi:hypothetical protein